MPDLPASDTIGTVCTASGSDVTIAANGITASFANEAVALLQKEGIKAEVLSVPVVKPLDVQTLKDSVAKTGKLLCVEEHVLAGGFSSAVSEAFMKEGISCRFDAIGIEDVFTETGPYEPLLAKYGISAENIAERAKKTLQIRRYCYGSNETCLYTLE